MPVTVRSQFPIVHAVHIRKNVKAESKLNLKILILDINVYMQTQYKEVS